MCCGVAYSVFFFLVTVISCAWLHGIVLIKTIIILFTVHGGFSLQRNPKYNHQVNVTEVISDKWKIKPMCLLQPLQKLFCITV